MTENRKARGSDRFLIVVAVLIAVVSVVSAAVIWRASLAASSASTADWFYFESDRCVRLPAWPGRGRRC